MMGRGFGHAGGRFVQGGFGRPMFFPFGGFFMFLLLLAFAALVVVAFWRIFTKAGFPGALSLLLLIPLVNIGMIAYLGFAEWPALKAAAPAPAPAVAAAPVPAPVTPVEEPAPASEDEKA